MLQTQPVLKYINNYYSKSIRFENSDLNQRIKCLELDPDKIELFLSAIQPISLRDLEFVPYNRFLAAQKLNDIFDGLLQQQLNSLLKNPDKGAIYLSLGHVSCSREALIIFSTAISYLIGNSNIDLLSGKYYATFIVGDDKNAPINLLRPYDNFKVHTDGAFMREPTDWLIMTKLEEQNVIGGETRLLHMKDWEYFDHFYSHRLGKKKFHFIGPSTNDSRAKSWGNHRKTDSLEAEILIQNKTEKSIRFVDQFIHPRTIEEAIFISEIQKSLEQSKQMVNLKLPVGSMLIMNNHYWVHGRNKFVKTQYLKREFMRQRGGFYA